MQEPVARPFGTRYARGVWVAALALIVGLAVSATAGCGSTSESSLPATSAEQPKHVLKAPNDAESATAVSPRLDRLLGDVQHQLPEAEAELSQHDRATVDALEREIERVRRSDRVTVEEMFDLQTHLNHLAQLREMSGSVVDAMNAAIASMARNVKS